ncbi:hypothetical protein V8E51_013387 [Hyaloscypha variabilis]
MVRDSTAIIASQESNDKKFLFHGLEANLIAEMENGSAKKERHKHVKEMTSLNQEERDDSQVGHEEEGVHKKKKKKKHRGSSQQTSSQDIDGISVDLDAPQRYIPTPEHKSKSKEPDAHCEKLKSPEPLSTQVVEQEQASTADQSEGTGDGAGSSGTKTNGKHKRKSSETLERSVFEGVAATIDAEALDLQLAKIKAAEKNTSQSKKEKYPSTVEPKECIDTPVKDLEHASDSDKSGEEEEKAKRKGEKRRRKKEKKAARKSLEGLKQVNSEEHGEEGIKEDATIETPKKKRKRDKEEHHEVSKVDEILSAGDQQTPRSISKKKRKLDESAQSTPLILNTIPAHDANSSSTPIIKSSSYTHIEGNAVDTTPTPKSKKARKLSQESPLHLHAVPAYVSSETSNSNKGDNDDGKKSDKKRKKSKKANVSKESVVTTLLVPSRLLTPAAKATDDLLQTGLKSPTSYSSSSISASAEVTKATSSDNKSSSEDETEQRSRARTPSPTRPPNRQTTLPHSPSVILPKKEKGDGVRRETPIPPPKRLVPTATRSPVIIPKLAGPKKAKAESMVDSDDEENKKPVTKRKMSTSKKSKQQTEEESFSQTIASMKKATDSKIHDLFSDDESESDEQEDPFAQAFDSIRKSSWKLANLFSKPEVPPAKIKGEKGAASAKNARARSVSTSSVQPLAFNCDGLNKASEDWETKVGKIRSAAGDDDDSEAQENIAFSASYIASRSAGIKISNTTFQVHTLRHNEGWVASSAEREAVSEGKDFKLKICTIVSGQLQVRLGNNAFGISKGSVFRVRNGEECVVRNEKKKTAVVWVVCVE